MSNPKGNAVVAQSGGPTAVINSSACGVIEEALRHRDLIGNRYGANNGIIHEDLFDLGAESADAVAPADKIHRLATQQGYELRVRGIAKTIDNDLVGADHCPGHGSVAKYLATCVMEAGRDTEAMCTVDPVTITEAMGCNTGWIAAATGLAKRSPDVAPNLKYVPEIVFDVKRFVTEALAVFRRLGRCFVVVSAGVKNAEGKCISDLVKADTVKTQRDMIGHHQLGGVAAYLAGIFTSETNLKARYNKLETMQRNALHFASKTDSDEAYRCGQEAARQALGGATGKMVNLVRVSNRPYRCESGLVSLPEVANGVKMLPRDHTDGAGTGIPQAMRDDAGPLVVGEVPIRIGAGGLPVYTSFLRKPVARKLPPWPKH